jgi:hypothetical protein
VYVDTVIDTEAQPLLPNQEYTFKPGIRFRPEQPKDVFEQLERPMVTAGIFADGTTDGDPALLARLMLRRSNMLLAVETALEALSDAGRQSTSRYQLIVLFRKMADSLHRWYLPPDQQIGLRVYQPIFGELINMPKGQDGSPDPLATFIAEETAMLRKWRITLSESQPSLADWNSKQSF